jgi:hypothetical protein
MIFIFELNFNNLEKKKRSMLIKLLATTLLRFGLTFLTPKVP